jgi:manganese/iron transport system substrate-binding protein
MVRINTFSLAIALSGLVGCAASTPPVTQSPEPKSAATQVAAASIDRPLVVASNPVLCDLTRRIAGDSIELKCLIDAGSDPHEYNSKPEDMKAIEQAKLILYGGYNFEPGITKSVKASGSTAAVAVDEIAVPEPIQIAADHHEGHGEGHGEDHAEADPKASKSKEDATSKEAKSSVEPDPHVWHDAQNGRRMVNTIAARLITLNPAQSERYRTTSQAIDAELVEIDTWIKAQIATIPVAQRKLVTTHDALNYYGRAYGLPIEGALQGLSTDEKPTPSRVAELVATIKNSQVPTIFAESTGSGSLIQAVATEAGVKVADRSIVADGLGESGSEADSYAKMLVANTQTIVEGLGGRITPIQLKP